MTRSAREKRRSGDLAVVVVRGEGDCVTKVLPM